MRPASPRHTGRWTRGALPGDGRAMSRCDPSPFGWTLTSTTIAGRRRLLGRRDRTRLGATSGAVSLLLNYCMLYINDPPRNFDTTTSSSTTFMGEDHACDFSILFGDTGPTIALFSLGTSSKMEPFCRADEEPGAVRGRRASADRDRWNKNSVAGKAQPVYRCWCEGS